MDNVKNQDGNFFLNLLETRTTTTTHNMGKWGERGAEVGGTINDVLGGPGWVKDALRFFGRLVPFKKGGRVTRRRRGTRKATKGGRRKRR